MSKKQTGKRKNDVLGNTYNPTIKHDKSIPLTDQMVLLNSFAHFMMIRIKCSARGKKYTNKAGDTYMIGTKKVNITEKDLVDILIKQKGMCAKSGQPLFLASSTTYNNSAECYDKGFITEQEYNTRPSPDRIDSSLKEYNKDNVQFTTIHENLGKQGTIETTTTKHNNTTALSIEKRYILDKLLETKDTNSIKELWSVL